MARCVVNTLIVGRLEEKSKTFNTRIASTSEINGNVTCFSLKAEGPEVNFKLPASYDINAIGRHFLIRSFSMPTKKRQYTVCTCMKQDIYSEYVNAIN